MEETDRPRVELHEENLIDLQEAQELSASPRSRYRVVNSGFSTGEALGGGGSGEPSRVVDATAIGKSSVTSRSPVEPASSTTLESTQSAGLREDHGAYVQRMESEADSQEVGGTPDPPEQDISTINVSLPQATATTDADVNSRSNLLSAEQERLALLMRAVWGYISWVESVQESAINTGN